MATLVLNPGTEQSRFIQLDNPSILIGSAPDADVDLSDPSLSAHHARIEHKPDGYYLIALDSTASISVNGSPVTFQRMRHGDKLSIGETKAVLLLDDEDMVDEPAPMPQMLPAQRAQALPPQTTGSRACLQCGGSVMADRIACPHCGQSVANLPAMPMGFIPPIPASQAGPGMLPIIAFLAALSVVGAPIAFVLGLMTLSIIRRRGGTVRDRGLAKWSIGLGLVWMMLGCVAAAGLVRKMQKREQLNATEVYEAQVIRALKNLACAQKYARTIELFDLDQDGQGEYGNLALLPQTKSPFFDSDLADGEAYGYWFAIREVSEGQFLAVAEPIHYGVTGTRTFVIDQAGRIRGGDANGQRYGQIDSVLPMLQGERSAYYEIDDDIAKDVLNYIKSLSMDLPDQEKKQRIITRLREDYALTTVGRELDGLETSVDRFVNEQRAHGIYIEAQAALKTGDLDVALAKLTEIMDKHGSFSAIAAVERDRLDLRSEIAQQREQLAYDLFAQAEELERQGQEPQEVQRIYQRIEKLYPDTDVADRVATLKPELERQLRERSAENIFSDLMELSPERDFEEILNRANQLRRNYKDTNIFSKIGSELTAKERKARASSWRVKTETNMQAGRMRGALAQLESAARENPDLLYDLRDLCCTLYRNVANTLMKEGDYRQSLEYYEKLSQLLQASGSQDSVDADLLAELHNDVGQADFGLKNYKEARWHLASAAWKYQDNAQFNLRLGAASLYSGLYRSADTALTQSLAVREDMTQALLFRSYMNLRVVQTLERTLAGGFKTNPDTEDSSEETDETEPQMSNLIVSVNDETNDDGDIEVNTSVMSGTTTIAGPQDLDLQYSGARNNWFTQFAENATENASQIPAPQDLDLFLSFNYDDSSSIVLGFLQFLQDLQLQEIEKKLAASTGQFNAASQSEGRSEARRMGRHQVKASEQKNIAEFHSQLRKLRVVHLEDVDERVALYDMMETMKLRLRAAIADLKTAGAQQSQISSLTSGMLAQINEKSDLLGKASKLIYNSMKDEVDTRKRMLDLAEEMLLDDAPASAERDINRFRNTLLEEDGVVRINQALRSLRDSMDVRVDLDNILRAAEGQTPMDTTQQ